MEGSGTGLAAEQAAPWSTGEGSACERRLPAGSPWHPVIHPTSTIQCFSELARRNLRTFSADEAPADVDVLVVLDPAARREVVGTDDAVVGEDDAARRHAEVCGMVRHGAAHAPHQTSCGQQYHAASEGQRTRVRKRGPARVTFGHVGAVGVGDEAGEADVDGAAETSADWRSGAKVGDALPVVELAAHGDHAAAHVLAALLAHEAGVDA